MLWKARSQPRQPELELFLISFLILFMELAAIRWFPAYVVFLTFFSNFTLISVFVGMSVGCLAARRRVNMIYTVPALTLISVIAAAAVYVLTTEVGAFALKVGDPNDPARVFFGTIFQAQEGGKVLLPIELVIAVFFALIALIFVGIGQELGRSLLLFESRIKAYTINILGSLAGILVFTALSYLSVSALWWFFLSFACLLWFFRDRRGWLVCNAVIVALCLLAVGGIDRAVQGGETECLWSPYYMIRYSRKDNNITVNTISHQHMADRKKDGIAYSLPYLLRRNADGKPLEDILIIGAGMGNDTAHALWHDAKRIDAVEIDPLIADLGGDHPNRPYADPRTNLVIADGRSFLKNTDRKYDMIVYALLDSLTLHSCYSSVRLESFLFTREALEDVRSKLKDGGLFVAYNYYRQGWVISRFYEMLASVFDQEPIVIALPSRPEIRDTDQYRGMTVLMAGDIEAIRQKFGQAGAYALDLSDLEKNLNADGFDLAGRGSDSSYIDLFPARVISGAKMELPTDDWPFFYLKYRHVPPHNIWGLAIVLFISLAILAAFAPVRSVRFNPHFFFLGAGFMLVETNSVIRLALLFGSTWLVNSIVFFSILVMILLANLYVIRRKPTRMKWYYVALAVGLLLNIFVDLGQFLAATGTLRLVASCLFLFLPMLFGGIIFASSFRQSANPDMDFGANIAGVVLGGSLEYLSLVTGYRLVLVMVLALYMLSLIGLRRLRAAVAAA